MYNTAAVNPDPVIVLMHWANGDQNDWIEIAYWLQNRGLGGKSVPDYAWLDPSWFPPLLEGASYAVFTFTFSECEGGCKSFISDQWLLDAHAAREGWFSLTEAASALVRGGRRVAKGAPRDDIRCCSPAPTTVRSENEQYPTAMSFRRAG